MHEKVEFLQTVFNPLIDANDPFINAGIIGFMFAISNKTNHGFSLSEFHVHTIASTGSICNHSAYSQSMKVTKQPFLVLQIAEPFFVTQFQENRPEFLAESQHTIQETVS